MTAVYPGRKQNQFNLVAQARRQAGSTFKTFVLAEAVNQGINPASSDVRLGPVPLPARPVRSRLGRLHVQPHVLRDDQRRAGDPAVRQHRLRAADARRRPAERRRDGAPAGRAEPARAGAVDRARLERRLAARHGLRLRHDRRRRDLLEPMAIRKVILANGKEDDRAGWGKPKRKRVIPDGVAYDGDADPRAERPLRDGHAGELRQAGRRARRARPTTTPTPGSAATCRTSRRPSGSAIRRARSRWRTCTGSPLPAARFPAEIWRLFVQRADAVRAARRTSRCRSRYPVWKPFQRGRYAIQYVPSTSTTSTTRDDRDGRRPPTTGPTPPTR